jgi:hypothetical protein
VHVLAVANTRQARHDLGSPLGIRSARIAADLGVMALAQPTNWSRRRVDELVDERPQRGKRPGEIRCERRERISHTGFGEAKLRPQVVLDRHGFLEQK